MKCPNCQSTKRQVKNGLNPSGSQKYRCNECQSVYTPKPNGYPSETRLLAIRIYVEGNSYHCIARILKVNPQSVANWVNAYTVQLLGAKQYYSDVFPVYGILYYGAPYELRSDKLETYAVEAVNADLRHYLKRLARQFRCFSRRMHSLIDNIRLFVYCYNQRQLAKCRFPKYSFHLVDFVSLPV